MTDICLTKNKILKNSRQLAKKVNEMSDEQRNIFFQNLEKDILQTENELQALLVELNNADNIQHKYIPEKHKAKIVVLTSLFAGVAGGLFGYSTKQDIFSMITNSAMFSLIGVLVGEITCKVMENKSMKNFTNKIKKSKLESAILKKYKQKLALATKLKALEKFTDYQPTKEVKSVFEEKLPQKSKIIKTPIIQKEYVK